MRRVKFILRANIPPKDNKGWTIEKKELTGVFHEFGLDYEELESGPGHFSTAIIEADDGELYDVPVRDVQFLDKWGPRIPDWTTESQTKNRTWCPECGPFVEVDEDGCCVTCGADSTGSGVETALMYFWAAQRIIKADVEKDED
jgi:hypothetical protein